MLAVVVFVGFHDPHPGNAHRIKGPVMTAPAKPVQPVNHHHIQRGNIAVGAHINIAGQIARGRIHFTTGKAAHAGFFGRFHIPRTFGKHPRNGVVGNPINARDIADHVIIQHRLDPPAMIQRIFGNNLAAKQALFLARQSGINDRAGKFMPG